MEYLSLLSLSLAETARMDTLISLLPRIRRA
jgi:hypothetical protein